MCEIDDEIGKIKNYFNKQILIIKQQIKENEKGHEKEIKELKHTLSEIYKFQLSQKYDKR